MPVDREKKIISFLLCCNNEIGVVGSLPLKEIAHKVESDSDSGWEDDESGLVKMIEEMKVDDSISMEVDNELDIGMIMEMEMEEER